MGTGSGYILSDPDAYLHAWNLWWVKTALVDLFQSPYWTNFNGFPNTISLTFHQLILPLGVFSIPLWSLGLHAGEVLAFWQYMLPVLGYVGMFLLIRHLGGSNVGACFGGLYVLFTPIGWENLARPDSLSYLLIPWLAFSVCWTKDKHWSWVSVPVFLTWFIVLMSPYYAVGLGILWLLCIPVTNQLNLTRGRLVAIFPLAILLASFEWLPQVLNEHPNPVNERVIEAFSADLTGIFFPHPHFWWVPESVDFWSETWTAGIHSSIYPGWVALIVGLSVLPTLNSSTRKWIALVGGVFFLMCIGPGIRIMGHTYLSGYFPYGIGLSIFDQLRAFRIPLRFGYFLILMVPLGIGLRLSDSWISVAVGIILLMELVRAPMTVRPLPKLDKLNTVRQRISEQALVPVPLTDWASEAQFGQTIHRKKFPLEGISYTPEKVWSVVGENPVLSALFNQKELPKRGWNELKQMGFGGVIIHTRILEESRAKKRIYQLKEILGEPVVRSERFLCFSI